jgi:hypothetical protein
LPHSEQIILIFKKSIIKSIKINKKTCQKIVSVLSNPNFSGLTFKKEKSEIYLPKQSIVQIKDINQKSQVESKNDLTGILTIEIQNGRVYELPHGDHLKMIYN